MSDIASVKLFNDNIIKINLIGNLDGGPSRESKSRESKIHLEKLN